jgi:hypothetical protein
MDFRTAFGHSRTTTNIMNIVQKIRASHLNRHGFIDVLVGVVLLQALKVSLIAFFCNLNEGPGEDNSRSIWVISFFMLIFAPLLENLLLIGFAAVHEKLFNRNLLFLVSPFLMAALHFRTPQNLPFPSFIRLTELYFFFYIFLKQYDLHKLEMGKRKAFLLSSALHFASNATVLFVLCLIEFFIDAETNFSAQPGE